MFPLMLNLAGRTVLVVGAGVVGTRRTLILLTADANVRLVDPRPTVSPPPHPQLERFVEPYSSSHLHGVDLAFACATSDVNLAVVNDARSAGIWVCDAAVPDRGNVIVPSVARQGGLLFAVSTSGASPTLAKRIKQELTERYDPSYSDWVRVLGEVRTEAMTTIPDATARRSILAAFCELHWLERIRTAGADITRKEMLTLLSSVG